MYFFVKFSRNMTPQLFKRSTVADLKLKMRDIFSRSDIFSPLGYFSCGSDSCSQFRIAFLSLLAEVAEEVSCGYCALEYQYRRI